MGYVAQDSLTPIWRGASADKIKKWNWFINE
jgi:hypothetical protein